jgi:glycosyltransferase involved in cell wall biosynthesis
MSKIPCSAPILTLNRKVELEKLLPILVETFDDVYIMDGNSTDGTQEYARSLGVRVEKQFDTDEPNRRITDFGAMREKLWSKAKYDWFFIADSDEEVTPEITDRIRRTVAENRENEAYTFPVLTKLPDGRIVQYALYYPFRYIRLFRRSSGITLGARTVHERFSVPEHVRVIDLDEPIVEPQPTAKEWRARQLKYLALEVRSMPEPALHHLWRWIIWYNVRSFFGQLFRALIASFRGIIHGKTALPWSYNCIFLEYRILSMIKNANAWRKKRKEREPT